MNAKLRKLSIGLLCLCSGLCHADTEKDQPNVTHQVEHESGMSPGGYPYFAATLSYEYALFKWKVRRGYQRAWISKVIGQVVRPGEPAATLYLGALPLTGKDGAIPENIANLKINAVLSATREFELTSSAYGLTPISPEAWKKEGVRQMILPLRDGDGYSPEQINDAVAFIKRELAAGSNVLVHCKAGKGRSASLVVAYLMDILEMNFEAAIKFLKAQRVQVHLNKAQIGSVNAWSLGRSKINTRSIEIK